MTAFSPWRKDDQKKKFALPPTLLIEKDKMRKDYRKSYFIEGGESSARSPFEGPRALHDGRSGSLPAATSCQVIYSKSEVKILS
jgi:hypothetical protein